MKTPSHFEYQYTGPGTGKSAEQYARQKAVVKPFFKKNVLLTPFLLSLPVICIVFALTSNLNEGLDSVTAEPLQQENSPAYDAGTITDYSSAAVPKRDSNTGIAGSKTVAFSAKH